MKKLILKYVVLIFGVSLLFYSCEKETHPQEQDQNYFKTVPIEDVLGFINQKSGYSHRNADESYITAISGEVYQEEISNSDEFLSVVPVNTVYENLISRVLLLEINGDIQSVVFSTNPFEGSTDESFSGELLITDMDGNFIDGYRVEDNVFVSQYMLGGISQRNSTNDTDGSCSCPYSICDWCQLDEVVINSGTSSPPTPYIPISTIYPMDGGGSGDEHTWSFGGGGSGSFNQTQQPSQQNPCDKVNSLETDSDFKDKLEELEVNTSLNYETGYILSENENGGYDYFPMNGNPNQPQIIISLTGTIDGFIHSHFLPGGNSIFSTDDIQAIYQLYTNGHINNVNTFFTTVVTPQGTSYTLIINNATAFSLFGQNNLTGTNFNTFDIGYESDFHQLHNLFGLDEITAREVAMLNAIENSGLSLLKGNSDFDDWQKIGKNRNNNGTVNVNCN